jgi:succinylglutamate desuccinylase
MAERENPTVAPTDIEERVLGRVRGDRPGPTVLAIGGIHGNEPAGIRAARRVLAGLERRSGSLAGEFVALAGNLAALERGTRFVRWDLNRAWSPEAVARVRERPDEGSVEDREMRELLEVIDGVLERADGEAYFLDLHTCSAAGCPFVTVGDTLRNRAFASRFPLPLILGLEEQVDGALLEHLNNRGLVTMGVEGGQHTAPESADYLEAVLWMALTASGMAERRDVPGYHGYRDLLRKAAEGAPPVIGVRHRHAVAPGDGFRMKPGFTNFQPVRKGTVIAYDGTGEVEAPEDGMVLLPLYQGQGNDGFFIAREVKPLWLRISTVLRRLRVGSAVRFMPGVRAHPEAAGTLVVDTRVARLFPLEILHLLGYRKLRAEGPNLLVSRRRFDLSPPPPRRP